MCIRDRPSDVGVIVMNVTSVAFVSKYLETGMPLTTKRLTVDGDIVKQPKNVEVIIGTPIQELLDFCGGLTAEPGKILYGGPMMGTCVADLSQPILKNNKMCIRDRADLRAGGRHLRPRREDHLRGGGDHPDPAALLR